MEPIVRMLEPWIALAWGVLGTLVWAFNVVGAVASDPAPSLDAVLIVLALTVTGVTVGITVRVVAELIVRGRHLDGATGEEQSLWMLPMGVGLLGLVTTPVFGGSPLSTMEWVVLGGGALAGGFILGTVPRVGPRRPPPTATSLAGPPLTGRRH